ncbi:MAG: hypothetical protein M3342_05930 [Bacteroidota bacterium]|nr:hypothetical protein [Flavisolibacter sp.]MDQ3843539.1 hypothetical protein [Bacteroidota bacterium]MBD0293780.1 hypothetical protein [Flavisolibacter sp.]MBD0350350.1 hypothetical protein [Flavisolibacter sp.]MBD0365574.1 hypothetical protein [Flavisolibacter sp.]
MTTEHFSSPESNISKDTSSSALLFIVADVKGYALQHNIPFNDDHAMLLMAAMNNLMNYKDESNPLRRYDGSTII